MHLTRAQYPLKTPKQENKCSDECKEYFLGHNITLSCVGEQKGNEKNRTEVHKVCTIMKNNVDAFIHFFH